MPELIADLRLDHVGVQVRDLESAVEQLVTLFGYHQATEPVVNHRQQVRVVFLEKPGSIPLKLISFIDDQVPPTTKLHHLAFYTEALDDAVEALRARGARLLSAPAPGEAFDDAPIAFLLAGGLNVELVSTQRRRGRLEATQGHTEE